MKQDIVLVTGISGFIGKHVALSLAGAGYQVRGTVRNVEKAAQTRQTLEANGVESDALSFVETDLLADAGWAEAMAGCRFVMHVASPVAVSIPKDPNDLIRPAREGTERVLAHAEQAGVERLVLTSSEAAILPFGSGNGHFNESSWADEGKGELPPYPASKTQAERAAWAFAEAHPNIQIAAVNPSVVLGPPLDKDVESSSLLIKVLMEGRYPATPKLDFAIVDVRDVANLHVAAMEHPAAAGKRFVASNDHLTMLEISKILADGLPAYAKKLPKRTMPNALVWLIGLFDADAKGIRRQLSVTRTVSNKRAGEALGFEFQHSGKDAVVAMGARLVELGLV